MKQVIVIVPERFWDLIDDFVKSLERNRLKVDVTKSTNIAMLEIECKFPDDTALKETFSEAKIHDLMDQGFGVVTF